MTGIGGTGRCELDRVPDAADVFKIPHEARRQRGSRLFIEDVTDNSIARSTLAGNSNFLITSCQDLS